MRAYGQGAWCFQTGQSPQVWRELSRLERNQFLQAAHDAKKKGW